MERWTFRRARLQVSRCKGKDLITNPHTYITQNMKAVWYNTRYSICCNYICNNTLLHLSDINDIATHILYIWLAS